MHRQHRRRRRRFWRSSRRLLGHTFASSVTPTPCWATLETRNWCLLPLQEEKEFSEEQSALVGHAYTTLRHPLRRAIYLVRYRGRQQPNLPAGWQQCSALSVAAAQRRRRCTQTKTTRRRISGSPHDEWTLFEDPRLEGGGRLEAGKGMTADCRKLSVRGTQPDDVISRIIAAAAQQAGGGRGGGGHAGDECDCWPRSLNIML